MRPRGSELHPLVPPGLWWEPFIRGLILVAVGGYALFRPHMTVSLLVQVIGICIALYGVLAVAADCTGHAPRRLPLGGLLQILLGVLLFAYPEPAAGLTAVLLFCSLGLFGILIGVMVLIGVWRRSRPPGSEGGLLREFPLGAVVTLVFGLVLLLAPVGLGLFFVRFIGLITAGCGIASLAVALQIWLIQRQMRA